MEMIKFACETKLGYQLILIVEPQYSMNGIEGNAQWVQIPWAVRKLKFYLQRPAFGIEMKCMDIYTIFAIKKSLSSRWYDCISSQNSFRSHRLVPKHLNSDKYVSIQSHVSNMKGERKKEKKKAKQGKRPNEMETTRNAIRMIMWEWKWPIWIVLLRPIRTHTNHKTGASFAHIVSLQEKWFQFKCGEKSEFHLSSFALGRPNVQCVPHHICQPFCDSTVHFVCDRSIFLFYLNIYSWFLLIVKSRPKESGKSSEIEENKFSAQFCGDRGEWKCNFRFFSSEFCSSPHGECRLTDLSTFFFSFFVLRICHTKMNRLLRFAACCVENVHPESIIPRRNNRISHV